MARSSSHLIDTLRQVAENLENGADYNWGNATKCNCAHLVQCLAPETASATLREIRPQLDEWTEFANDYCPHSGTSTDQLLDSLYEHGLTHADIHQLEYLSNRRVLEALPGGFRYLEHGNRRHVALYMRTWASLLELDLREAPPERKTSNPGCFPSCQRRDWEREKIHDINIPANRFPRDLSRHRLRPVGIRSG